MKLSALISIGLFVVGALVFLLQLWFSFWSPEILYKILTTLGVLLVVVLVVSFVSKEAKETERLKDGHDL
jgi:uncharacterized membrane-anchored protein